jgi:putative membrane protein (TIGR04086 family)
VKSSAPQHEGLQIRWTAAATGFLVDYTISALIMVFANPGTSFTNQPSLTNPTHLFFFAILLLSTGVGGYVAGRVARVQHALHGLLVGVFGILLNQLTIIGGAPNPAPLFIFASALGCVIGACGGLISRYDRSPVAG